MPTIISLNKYISIVIVCSLISFQSIAQHKISWIESSKIAKFEIPIYSISPDAYSMSMGQFNEKWNNKVGGEIGIFTWTSKKINVSFLFGGFINLYDFSKYQFLSWQLWRGNLGFTSYFEWKPLSNAISKSSRLTAELAYIHESQHATDVFGYVYLFTTMSPYYFPNGSIRSFEFYKAQINYSLQSASGNWIGDLHIGYKFFPQPELPTAGKTLLNAYIGEAGIQRRIIKKTFVSLKMYYESIQNNFVASEMHYKGDWNKEPFLYRIAEIGFVFYGKQYQAFNLFANVSHSNGRGLDFPAVNNDFGGGFRVFF